MRRSLNPVRLQGMRCPHLLRLHDSSDAGIGRIAKKYFSSRDQLVTLGCGAGPTEAFPGAGYTGWQLGRAFGALINNHNVGGANVVVNAAADSRNLADWSDVTFIHCTRWQDDSRVQIRPCEGRRASRRQQQFQ